jgi:hypothetical protein
MCAGGRSTTRKPVSISFSFVPGTSLRQRIVHAWLDVAFGLPANGGELRNNQEVRSFEHAMLAKGKGLAMAQEI